MNLSRRRLLQTSASTLVGGGLGATLALQDAVAQTPEVPAAGMNGPLRDLATFFSLAPLSNNFTGSGELMTFGDLALRLEQVGVDLNAIAEPEEKRRQLGLATLPVPFAELVRASFQAEDPVALFGWNAFDIDQSAYVMSDAMTLTVLRGRFDVDLIQRAWDENGYALVEQLGVPAASISAEPSFDVTTELGRLTLGKANNVAAVDDRTLIYASSLAGLEGMIESHRGDVESLGVMSTFNRVVAATPDALSGAVVLGPGAFVAPPAITAGESGIEFSTTWEPGPLPLLGLVGFASGPELPETGSSEEPIPSGSRQIAVRHFLTEAELDVAAKRTLLYLDTQGSITMGLAWSEVFAGWQVWTDPENSAVISSIDLFGNEGAWLQALYARDAWYLYG
ncbi:MAG: hypothetical protein KF883_01085 [Thermomicrobiales bacterium]|nr:hypothetical protein [Thermomicrobiales bacterium]